MTKRDLYGTNLRLGRLNGKWSNSMRVRKIGVGMGSLIALTALVQASTIVNWGAPGGDTGIVTANAAGVYGATYTDSYVSPADGLKGYDVNAAGQTREYYGAMDAAGGLFQVLPLDRDAIQMVSNFRGAAGTLNSMIAWEAADFLTGDRKLESLTLGFSTRGGSTTSRWLIETTDGWYQSNVRAPIMTSYNVFDESTDLIGDLTWSSFGLFGLTAGTGAADPNNVLSVGALFTTVNTGRNYIGGMVEYFNVTATPSDLGDVTLDGLVGGNKVLSWDTFAGQIYNLEASADLASSNSNWVIYATIIGDGSPVSVTISPIMDQLFYKVTSP
jgi:hypothetical protein